MIKRIKYIKDSNGNYTSQNYVKNQDNVFLRVGFVPGVPTKGFVKSVDNDTIHITLTATTPHKIKIKIKKTLAKLGCIFEKEKRKPRITA